MCSFCFQAAPGFLMAFRSLTGRGKHTSRRHSHSRPIPVPRRLHRSTMCSIRWLGLCLKHHHPHCECQYPWTSMSQHWFLINDGFLRLLINPVNFAVSFLRQKIWMKVSGPFPVCSCALVGWSHGFVLWLLSKQAHWYPLLWYSPLFLPWQVLWKALMKHLPAPFMHSDRVTVCHSVSLSSHLFAPLMFHYLPPKARVLFSACILLSHSW